MGELHYLEGDATVPQAKGKKIIAHVCNDIGRWGKGFVLAVSARWDAPEAEYRTWHRRGDGFALGAIQLVRVEAWIWIANMIAQRGTKAGHNGPPIRYDAVESCLTQLAVRARDLGASVHMPRIGCDLEGGTWEEIEPIVQRTLLAADVAVFVYGAKPNKNP
jgi:O-acetyl-ADP-ribose deacetylase (regulator of RNase III)